MFKKRRNKKRRKDNSSSTINQDNTAAEQYCSSIAPLEQRIMLSATWIDADPDGADGGDAPIDGGDDAIDEILNSSPITGSDDLFGHEDTSSIIDVLSNDTDPDGDQLTVSGFEQPEHGTVAYNDNGTFTFTPDANFNGTDSFTYSVSDGNGGVTEGTVNINVSAVNDAPVAANSSFNTTEEVAVTTGNVLTSATDLDGDELTVSDFEQPAHGTVEYNNDGTFSYTPDQDFSGSDSFTYTISDGNGGSSIATIQVNVANVNDAPTAVNDTVTVNEDGTITTGNVLANDFDVDGDDVELVNYDQPEHGTLSYNNDGTFSYTPDANYNGSDSFSYTVTDGNGETHTADVEITVAAVNDAPTAVGDSYTTDEDIAITTGNVLENASDIDGDMLSIGSFTQPEHGSVEYNNDGTFTYTPAANYHGTDSFTYTVSDGNGGTVTETISLSINSLNDNPTAGNDTITVDEDSSVITGNLLDNDFDVDGETVFIDGVSSPSHGSVVYHGDGTFTYTPDPDYCGNDSFTYTIKDGVGGESEVTVDVVVNGVNDNPEAEDDRIIAVEDTTLVIDSIFDNDFDLDGDTLTVTDFDQPEHGSLEYNDDGTFTYTPDANYNGRDEFNYTVSDGNGGTDTATVVLRVRAVNDTPDGGTDSYTVTEDGTVTTGNVLVNDSDVDGDTLHIAGFTQAEHGSVANNGDGTFTYTPDGDFNGADSFTYTIIDGNGGEQSVTVNVDVTAVNDAPEAEDDRITILEDSTITTGNILANDVDVDGDELIISDYTTPKHGSLEYNGDGTFNYTPDANYNGPDSFTYTVTDAEGITSTATMDINVESVNDAPITAGDTYTTNEDSTLVTGNVLANDTDVEGNTLGIAWYSQPEHGSVSFNGDGTFTYTPDTNYNGTDNFTYTITDGRGEPQTENITINVNAVNDAPTARNIQLVTGEDDSITTGNLLNSVYDVDGDTLTITDFSQASHGTVVSNEDGTFTYTPDHRFDGTDSFTYTVSDEDGETTTATVYVEVEDNRLDANSDTYETSENVSFRTGNVMSNDGLHGSSEVEITDYSGAFHGTVEYNGDGTFTYTPDDNFSGNDYFRYTLTDEYGDTDSTLVKIRVSNGNADPNAANDTFYTDEDVEVVTGNVLTNDYDLNGDDLSITDFSQGSHGSVNYNDDGTFTYTPDSDYHGTDTFSYTVSDGNGGTDTATVTVNVGEVIDNPDAVNDSFVTNEDTTLVTGNVLANDVDVEGGHTLFVYDFDQPSHGHINYNDDGTFTYSADANYHGEDSFTYVIYDGEGGSDTATVYITVNSVNDAPEGEDVRVSVNEDNVLTTGNLLADVSDVDGDALHVDSFSQPEHGSLVSNGDGTFTYTPDENYHGGDSFTYTAADDNGGSTLIRVDINVNSVNDAPIALNDSINVDEDGVVSTGNVLTNDYDIDGDNVLVYDFEQPEHGSVKYNGDGTFSYKPDADYNGSDSFTYTVIDGNGGSDTATININISSVNDEIDAQDASIVLNEDTSATTDNVFTMFDNVDVEELYIDGFTASDHGTVTYNGDGTFTYTPDDDFYGTDSFTYTMIDESGAVDTATINIVVRPVNDAPVAGDDDVSLAEDNNITIASVFANDYDIDGNAISAPWFTQAEHGTVSYNGDGTFDYTPDQDYNGSDSFTYTLIDGQGGVDTATVYIDISAVNDAPVAHTNWYGVNEDNVLVTGNVIDNDVDVDGDEISIIDYGQASHGTVSYNADGTFTYIAEENYHGNDSFTYTITDADGETDTSRVYIGVNSVNDAPVAAGDSMETIEDISVTSVNVFENDFDVDGDELTVSDYQQPAHGTVTYNNDGTFTYTPDLDYNGTDSFTYTVSDGHGGTDTSTMEINITASNDAPRSGDDRFFTLEDQAVTTANVFANDYEVEGDDIIFLGYTQPSNGTIEYHNDGTFTYTPNENFNGLDYFTYDITDEYGAMSTQKVFIDVTPVNDAPVAFNDSVSATEDVSQTFNVIGNDTDIDGDVLDVSEFTQPEHGTLVYNGDGEFTYTPDANYNGSDSFTYTASDGHGGFSTAEMSISITAVNDAPDIQDDTVYTNEDSAVVTQNVLANDSDVEGDTINITDFGQGSHGTVEYNNDGTFTYTPDANYNGSDSFTYTVSDGNGGVTTGTVNLSVGSVNDAPVTADDNISVSEDGSVTAANLLANDSDIDGDALIVDGFTMPEHGTVNYNNDGTFTYTPDSNYNGTDSFTYTVSDGNGGTSTSTVRINVNAIEDAPEAANDAVSGLEDQTITTGIVIANDIDVDGDALSISDFTQAGHGVVVNNGDGTFSYTPDADYNGADSFTYTITDNNGNFVTAQVDINVTEVNDAPVVQSDIVVTSEDTSITTQNVLANDSDVDGDSIAITDFGQGTNGSVIYNNDGTFTYTPNDNFNGSDSFTYTVSDGRGGITTGTVNVNVSAVNDSYQAIDDSVSTSEDTAVNTGNVLANDINLDGDNFQVSDFTQPEHGSAVYNNDGTFSYRPDANYHGSDSFTYTVTDAGGETATATISITVDSVNDNPVAADDTAVTSEDTPVRTVNVLANDTDLDGDTLSVSDYSQGAHGKVVYNNDGTFTYTPEDNYNGTDSFTYSVSDGQGGTDTAVMTINVTGDNDAPEAASDTITTSEDRSVTTGVVTANDTDIDGDTLTVTGNTDPENGTVTYNNDGTFTYKPNANYNGTDSFTYTVSDGHGGYDTATVNIVVETVNDAPRAGDDSIFVTEDSSVTTSNLLKNDKDADGDTLRVSSISRPEHGTVIYNNDGTFTYTPEENYNGSDSFTYTVDDGHGGRDTAVVNIQVGSENDAPVVENDKFTTDEDVAITTGNVLANDTDTDGDSLKVTGFTNPEHGTVVYNEDGTFTYTPESDYNGDDSFTYTVSDGHGGTTTGTIAITVNPVEDIVASEDSGTVNSRGDVNISQKSTGNSTDNNTENNIGISEEELEAQMLAGLDQLQMDGPEILSPDWSIGGIPGVDEAGNTELEFEDAGYENIENDLGQLLNELLDLPDEITKSSFDDIYSEEMAYEGTEGTDNMVGEIEHTEAEEELTAAEKTSSGARAYLAGLFGLLRSSAGLAKNTEDEDEQDK